MTKRETMFDSRFCAGLTAWLSLPVLACANAVAAPMGPAAYLSQTAHMGTASLATPGELAPDRFERIDLSLWAPSVSPSAGNWVVDPGGRSVLQTVNGAPTSFLGSRNLIDVTISGTFEVFDTSDDDFIGLVFGYRAHTGAEAKADFLLFDWRGGEQSNAAEGFTLSCVSGPVSHSAGIGTPWWGHTHPSMDVLATDHGPRKGWRAGRKHRFELTYMRERLRISIDGVQVFDLPGDFQSGRFGFYNFSQAKVRYSALTITSAGHALALSEPR